MTTPVESHPPRRILAVCGSLQARSGNRALIDCALRVAPAGAEVIPFEGLRELPPFDPDVEPGAVASVERWRQALRDCEAVIVACPEYGFSVPGVLKNAIDWVIGSAELERKIVATAACVSWPERGRRGLEALHVPLRAVSARIVGGRPILKGPSFEQDVAALLGAIVREIERGDASPPGIEVWFDFASTYSYLAASRVEDLATRAHLPLVWRPFLLGPIFQKQGWADSPFNLYAAKGRYMWRDLERECERAALPFKRPSAFPRNGVRAARLALCAEREPWCGRFVRAVFHANFVEDRDIASAEVLAEILRGLDLPAEDLLQRAESAEQKPRLRQQIARAEQLGIFGAPSFLVDGELFWGDDRLDEAIAWARRPG
jgi:2-hydroxychromene-2-carboxylate isomerase/NAD(P)H-dependent FMN reductase